MPVPQLDPEQRREALDKAVAVRRDRAELRRLLRARAVTLGEVFARAEHAEAVASMRMSSVIEALPGYGKVRARRLMDEVGIAPSRRVRGVGRRQRERLLEVFGERSGS